MTAMAEKVLLASPKDPTPTQAEAVVEVARKFGVSPIRQFREMLGLRFGPGKLATHEYYSSGVFDPAIPMEDKRRYVGVEGSYQINVTATPVDLSPIRAFLIDKVMYTALLHQLGIATTVTQAVAHTSRVFGNMTTLRTPQDVMRFLTKEAVFPVFAKPVEGAASVGSVLLTRIERDQLVLGNGRQADMSAFAQEVFQDYPEGFLFQDAIVQHEDMTAMTGGTTGTIRVVTTRDANGIAPLYSVWKIPSPRAMSDNFWQSGSMVALLDDETGKVRQCRLGTGLASEWLKHHPVSGLAFENYQIPHWQLIQQTACEAHGLFPEMGVIGWDIAVGPDGPIIVECNDNTFHVLWQLAAGQGIRTNTFKARFEAARQESLRIGQSRLDLRAERRKARRSKA